MTQSRTARHALQGFTLIELIAVMVVMGILAVSLGLSNDDPRHSLDTQTELLRSRIRYAQSRAMGRNLAHGVACTNNTYFLFEGLTTGTRIVFPGQGEDSVSLTDDVTVTDFTISFDQWGRPYASANQAAALTTAQTITLRQSLNGTTRTESLSVTPVTGFVP